MLQVGWQLSVEGHDPSVCRVLEGEMRRVEEWPLQVLYRAKVRRRMPMSTAVDRIANDGMTDRAEMDADLMGPASRDRHPDQGHALEMLC